MDKTCDLSKGGFPLNELPLGREAVITAVNAPNALQLVLAELGCFPGERVKKVLQSPLGDPAAYLIRGSVTAIRAADAKAVAAAFTDDSGGSSWD